LTLYAEWSKEGVSNDTAIIYVVLIANDVNQNNADLHDVEGSHLTIVRHGISAQAGGETGKGSCTFPSDVAIEEFADLINTMVLFLVFHAGRVPLHASAIMLDGVAMVFAGASGAGKSTLSLAAVRAGLPLMSDDTIFVQTAPRFQLWSLAGPIHVFEKDAPDEKETGMRFRAGRWKKSLAMG